jgi:hypothetical protein
MQEKRGTRRTRAALRVSSRVKTLSIAHRTNQFEKSTNFQSNEMSCCKHLPKFQHDFLKTTENLVPKKRLMMS